jgi:hypothetical protein
MSETPLRSTSSEGTKQPGWSIQRQSQDTSYILYSGEWYATVNSENAEKLLELLKQTR